MNKPQLKNTIELKLLSIIKLIEDEAQHGLKPIEAKQYLQLADLYHFHKDFESEVKILKRFTQLDKAANDDLVEIYERIDRATQLKEIAEEKPMPQKLKLIPVKEDNEKVPVQVKRKTTPRINLDKKPFAEQSLRVLTVCVAYTGRSDNDEVVQIALVLFEYYGKQEKQEKLIDTYVGNRKPSIAIPTQTIMQFGLNNTNKGQLSFDVDRIIKLFNEADMVISHNDSEIERKLLATLIPELADKSWYSSQKDIPWKALGFETRRLTQLARALKEKSPRSCLERAVAIARIVQKKEPFSSQTFLERLYNMQPMKALEWTPELTRQSKRLKNAMKYKIAGILSVVMVTLLVTTWFFIG